MNVFGNERMSRSTLDVFRYSALLVSIAVGIQRFVLLGFLGAKSLPFLHFPMVRLVMQLADSGIIAMNRLDGIFSLVMTSYLLALAVFAAAFWIQTNPLLKLPAPVNAALLATQISLGMLINVELLYIVAAELMLVLTFRRALLGLGLQAIAYVALQLSQLLFIGDASLICNVSGSDIAQMPVDQHVIDIGIGIVMGLAFQAMAFGVGYLAMTEQRRRVTIAAAHSELLATRHLLMDEAGALERARIARDLHDAIGHHLTAMNLHLDLAKRQSAGKATELLQTAHALAQRLLAEVRKVVSVERAQSGDRK